MHYRNLGLTGMRVSEISLGTWAFGGDWGTVAEDEAYAALNRAVDLGVNFLDTADVYGDGRSERLIGRLLRERQDDEILVATKAGRRLDPHAPEGYDHENLSAFVERSLENLRLEALDLLQLHCPPSAVIEDDATYDVLDRLVEEGVIAAYGVSVETAAQALSAIARPHVASIQIILNAFRMKPLDEVLPAAQAAGVGIIARVPLASGLLSGKYGLDTTFAEDDHRSYNRDGSAFDVGETFSGVDYEAGLQAVEELRDLVPAGASLAQLALRWILMFPEVTAAIPGARDVRQTEGNAGAVALPPLSAEAMQRVRDLYDHHFRAAIHARW